MAGVTVGMRVCQFMGEELPESRTWAELKKVAKGTPKPWQFGFGHSQSVPAAAAAAAAAAAPPVAEPQQPAITPEERVKVRKLFRAARSGDEASLGQILDEGVEVNTATRVNRPATRDTHSPSTALVACPPLLLPQLDSR